MPRWSGVSVRAAALCAASLSIVPAPAGAEEGRRIEIFGGRGARLGVVLREVGSDDVARFKLPEERGAVVKEVQPETPAAKAGLKEGDVILRYQGETVLSVAQLVRMVRETPAGRKVALEVSRDGATQRVSATLEARDRLLAGDDFHFDVPLPAMPSVPQLENLPALGRGMVKELLRERGPRKLGIEYQEISGQLARYFRIPDEHGVLVSSVDDDGPAGRAGLKAGDVILKVGGKAVRGAGDLRDEVARLVPGQETTVMVQRDGKPLDLKLKIGGKTEGRSGDST